MLYIFLLVFQVAVFQEVSPQFLLAFHVSLILATCPVHCVHFTILTILCVLYNPQRSMLCNSLSYTLNSYIFLPAYNNTVCIMWSRVVYVGFRVLEWLLNDIQMDSHLKELVRILNNTHANGRAYTGTGPHGMGWSLCCVLYEICFLIPTTWGVKNSVLLYKTFPV